MPSTTPPAASSSWWNCATATPAPLPAKPRHTTTARRSLPPTSKTTLRTLRASSLSAAPAIPSPIPRQTKSASHFLSRIDRDLWLPLSWSSQRWAPTSPRLSPAPSTASPGNTSSTSIARSTPRKKARARSMRSVPIAPWSKNWDAIARLLTLSNPGHKISCRTRRPGLSSQGRRDARALLLHRIPFGIDIDSPSSDNGQRRIRK